MFTQNKIIKIILVAIIFVVISSTGIWLFTKEPRLKENETNKNGQEIKLNSKIIEEKVIASNGEGFPHFTLQKEGEEELIIAIYSYTQTFDKILEEPGFFIFKYNENNKVERIFQSSEIFPYGAGKIYFSDEDSLKDLNSDGVEEIIVYPSEAKGYDFTLWIYTWKNNSLKFISPSEGRNKKSLLLLDRERKLQFVDVEGDGKIEISLLYKKIKEYMPEKDKFVKEDYQRIYKWDGGEEPYYFWKEEKTGEEKLE